MFEYEEIIQQKYNVPTAAAFVALLKKLPNVQFYTSYYKWLLIDADPDDNTYADCAIAGDVHYLVSEDRHFQVLKNISFPKITVLSINDFIQKLFSDE